MTELVIPSLLILLTLHVKEHTICGVGSEKGVTYNLASLSKSAQDTLTGLRGILKSRRQPWLYREAIEILV